MVDELAAGTQVPVRVTVGPETWSATVRRRGDGFAVRMGERHRHAAGVDVGDEVEVTLAHEPGRRHVPLPDDLAHALDEADRREEFEALPWSHRKEHVLRVQEARASSTRERRIARVVDGLR